MTETPTFQLRVVQEKAELDEKLKKLIAFFETESYRQLLEEERDRLDRQCGAMSDYSRILGERINAFMEVAQ